MAPPTKNPDEARANDIAQKSESMARELSQKREMRIRQERVRHLSDEPAPRTPGSARPPARPPANADDKTLRAEDPRGGSRPRPEAPPAASPPFYPERRPSILDEVATELEEMLRDLRGGWRRWAGADRITFLAALTTVAGVLMPWTSDKSHAFQLGIVSGGAVHAALAAGAVALLVGRGRRGERGSRERLQHARRTSLWHLVIGAVSTLLCAYFLVIYGVQRSATTGLEIRFGLYVTLAAGMGLSYGGFARFWSRHEGERG